MLVFGELRVSSRDGAPNALKENPRIRRGFFIQQSKIILLTKLNFQKI